MAKHCTNCGHELREGEKFCAECGTAVGGAAAPVPQPVQYEYCTIVYGEPGGFMGMTGRFRVEASGPYGRHTLTVSDTCKGETYQTGLQQYLGPSARCQETLNQLMRSLTADGWELLPETEGGWWGHKFRE